MVATTKTPLGPTTTNRKWFLDVDTSPDPETPNWVGVHGITEFKPTVEGSLQNDSDFDGEGWGSQTNTLNSWKNEGKFKRGVKKPITDPPVYDPGQEAIRLAGASTGVDNSIRCRWYEMEPNGPRVEAYQGTAAVTYSEEGGGVDALSLASFVLTGQGKREIITHPDAPVGP